MMDVVNHLWDHVLTYEVVFENVNFGFWGCQNVMKIWDLCPLLFACWKCGASSKAMQILRSAVAVGGLWQGCGLKCTENKRRLMPTIVMKNGKRICDKKLIVNVKNWFIVVTGTAVLRPENHFKAHPCFFVKIAGARNGSLNAVVKITLPAIYSTGNWQCKHFLFLADTIINKDSNEFATEKIIFNLKHIVCRWQGGGEGPCFCDSGWCDGEVQKCGPGSQLLPLFYIMFIMNSSRNFL